MSRRLVVTRRAFEDLDEIDSYSRQEWGEDAAERYLEQFETALTLIKDTHGILRSNPDLSEHLLFYKAGNHLMVFTEYKKVIYLLTIKHERMDLIDRLTILEPTLALEVRALHKRLGR